MPNMMKYMSYRYGFQQIKSAIEAGFYMEAVMICESIISDRLHSAFWQDSDGKTKPQGARRYIGLGQLVKRARLSGIVDSDLLVDLEKWQTERNFVAHAVARSQPGLPTVEVSEFQARAKAAAETGLQLANRVKKWQRKQRAKVS